MISRHCSVDLSVFIKYRPINLPQEFTVILPTVVNIPPDASPSAAIGHPYNTITKQQSTYPEAVLIISGTKPRQPAECSSWMIAQLSIPSSLTDFMKFVIDTTVVRLMFGRGESPYRDEVEQLSI